VLPSKVERRRFGIKPVPAPRFWRPEQLKLLGTKPDPEIAKMLGRSRDSVQLARARYGIPAFAQNQAAATPARKSRRH
jgi:hypothetical protein